MDLPDASVGQEFGFDALRCPHCGGDYLHAKSPEYYGESIKPSVPCGSDDFAIGFWCESCSAESSLSILQHKGQTFIEWSEIVLRIKPATKRQPIKPGIRFQVLKRDDYRCQMCGVTAQDGAKLEIDHIHPVSKGGGNELSNLQVLCRDCNVGKRDHLL